MKVLFTLPNFAQLYLVFQAEKNQETIVFLHDSPQFYIPCSSPNLASFFLPLLFSLFFYHQWILPSFFTWFIDLQIFLVRFGLLY